MKLREILEFISSTQASDVEGIKKRVGKIVRRKVPAGYTKCTSKKKKRKKKKKVNEI